MDNFNEKKWFVYQTDHHEGPFSLDEVRDQIQSGTVTPEHYFWCEGMPDWKPMPQVPELEGLLKPPSVPPAPPKNPPPLEINDQIEEAVQNTATVPLETMAPESFVEGGFGGTQTVGMDQEQAQEAFQEAMPELGVNTMTPVPQLAEDSNAGFAAPALEETPTLSSAELSVEMNVQKVASTGPTQIVPENHSPESVRLGAGAPVQLENASHLGKELSEKEKKLLEKEEKRFQKLQEKKNKKLSGDKKSFSFTRVALILIFLGLPAAYYFGYLEPVTSVLNQNSFFRSGMKTIQEVLSPLLSKVGASIPGLNKFANPIDDFYDLPKDDFDRLKETVNSDLSSQGPRVALALSTKDVTKPVFYVASNLPDGTRFKVFLKGRPGTLLNHFDVSVDTTVTLSNHSAKTNPILNQGKPLPRGEYQVFTYETSGQPVEVQKVLSSARPSGVKLPEPNLGYDPRVVGMRVYFLGGERDRFYESRLRTFHSKVRKRGEDEVTELRAFYGSLQSQFDESFRKFSDLKRGKRTVAKAKIWKNFNNKWIQFNNHMTSKFKTWDSKDLQNNTLNSDLYQVTRSVGQSLSKMHELQNQYFSPGKIDYQRFDQEHQVAVSTTQNLLGKLKDDLGKAERRLAESRPLPGKG